MLKKLLICMLFLMSLIGCKNNSSSDESHAIMVTNGTTQSIKCIANGTVCTIYALTTLTCEDGHCILLCSMCNDEHHSIELTESTHFDISPEVTYGWHSVTQ